MESAIIELSGHDLFSLRVALSYISSKKMIIKSIRPQLKKGLTEYEKCLLELMSAVSIGSKVKFLHHDTSVSLQPGSLRGGYVEFTCHPSRGLTYYMEVLMLVAPFCREPLVARLRGCTHHPWDPAVECVRLAWLPLLHEFMGKRVPLNQPEGLHFQLLRRSCSVTQPGGEVELRLHPVAVLQPVQFKENGFVHKIRGVFWSVSTNSTFVKEAMHAAKGTLLPFTSNVFFDLQMPKRRESGPGRGYGGLILAECQNGTRYFVEAMCLQQEDENDVFNTEKPKEAQKRPSNAPAGSEAKKARNFAGDRAQVQLEEEARRTREALLLALRENPGSNLASTEATELGAAVANRMLQQIKAGGCVDVLTQPLACVWLGLAKGMSVLRLGQLSPRTIDTIRLMKIFFQRKYHFENTDGGGVLVFTKGEGVSNTQKGVK